MVVTLGDFGLSVDSLSREFVKIPERFADLLRFWLRCLLYFGESEVVPLGFYFVFILQNTLIEVVVDSQIGEHGRGLVVWV